MFVRGVVVGVFVFGFVFGVGVCVFVFVGGLFGRRFVGWPGQLTSKLRPT